MQEQEYDNLWIRWAPSTWEKSGGWKTSIQENTLHKPRLTQALFILQDFRCVFVKMDVLRQRLSGKSPNSRGTIMFEVNPIRKSIDGTRAEMDVVVSRTHRRQNPGRLIDQW